MDDANYNVAPPAYDDETAPAGATASPQPGFSFTDHKEKVLSMPNIVLMMTRKKEKK